MLKVRRDAELPAALCSARAREIAAQRAQRMISRKKVCLNLSPKGEPNATTRSRPKPNTSVPPSGSLIQPRCRSISTPLSFVHRQTMSWNRRSRMSSPKTASSRSSFVPPEAQRITPTLRVRRGNGNDASERPVRKPVSSASSPAQNTGSCGGIEGMIPLQYLWQNHSRAAHGKNCDTPSLGWVCF